jgi:arginine/lysine/histidine transporter system substrate-binding protein
MKLKMYLLCILAIALPSMGAWWFWAQKSQNSKERALIVGTNPQFPPFEFVENDQLKGFEVDLMEKIAAKLGKKIEWKSMPFDSLIPGIQTGSIQIIASGMTPTPERAQRILFTKEYLTGDPLAIIALANSDIKSIEDLKGKMVVVNEGYTSDFYMTKIEGPILLRLESPLEAFMALDANKAEAFVAAKNSVKPFLEKYGYNKYKIIPIPDTNESSALGISK